MTLYGKTNFHFTFPMRKHGIELNLLFVGNKTYIYLSFLNPLEVLRDCLNKKLENNEFEEEKQKSQVAQNKQKNSGKSPRTTFFS